MRVTAVTLEHIAPSVAHDIRSAPQDFQVETLRDADDAAAVTLGKFRYEADDQAPSYRTNVQTFEVAPSAANSRPVNLVRLRVLSNYGHDDFTCIYRFRVHGDKAE